MGLVEFLRQWQRGRLSGALLASVLLHALVLVALIGVRPHYAAVNAKRGDALFIELPKEPERAAPGAPGASATARSRPAAPPRAESVAKPIDAGAASRSPRVAAVEKPAPPAPPERRAATAPPVSTPSPPAPAPPTAPSTPAAETAAPHEPSPAPESVRPPDAPTPAPVERQVASAPASAPSAGRAFVPDIRALRGTAGAYGGGGDGRGGVEGDPVSLDNPDPKYAEYLLRVKRQIEEKMTYPCVKDPMSKSCDYKSAQLILEFGIRKDGELAFVQLRSAAAYPVFDDVSANAIKLASPFPPLPDAIRQLHPTGLPISAHFRYEFTQSFRSIIR